jgi:hypothetical protein
MFLEIETEQAEFIARPPITANIDGPAFIDDVLARVARGQQRMSDVQLMFQMFYCRHVDNFQIFLEELSRDIALAHPKLPEGIKVKKAERLGPEELRLTRMRRLSFLSPCELAALFVSTVEFEVFPAEQELRNVERLYDLRNLVTHNYGVADHLFVSRNPASGLNEGQQFTFTVEFIREAFHALLQISADIQKRAQARFNLWRTAT